MFITGVRLLCSGLQSTKVLVPHSRLALPSAKFLQAPWLLAADRQLGLKWHMDLRVPDHVITDTDGLFLMWSGCHTGLQHSSVCSTAKKK